MTLTETILEIIEKSNCEQKVSIICTLTEDCTNLARALQRCEKTMIHCMKQNTLTEESRKLLQIVIEATQAAIHKFRKCLDKADLQ